LLACGASFDIFHDPCPGTGPEVFSVHTSDCFISSGVAIKGAIVPGVHDFAFQTLVRGNDEVVCRGVLPEWSARAVYSFDGECALSFFHEGVIVVLDDGDEVFYGAEGVFISNADE
jgi:hypothetical protein